MEDVVYNFNPLQVSYFCLHSKLQLFLNLNLNLEKVLYRCGGVLFLSGEVEGGWLWKIKFLSCQQFFLCCGGAHLRRNSESYESNMANVRDSDTSLWLHNKLGTSNDSWTGSSICSQLNAEVLRNIKDCFPDLQTQVKLKLLLSFFHIPRRNVDEVLTFSLFTSCLSYVNKTLWRFVSSVFCTFLIHFFMLFISLTF